PRPSPPTSPSAVHPPCRPLLIAGDERQALVFNALRTQDTSRLRKNWHPGRLLSRSGDDGAGRRVGRARDAGNGWEASGDVQLRLARATDSGRPSVAADPGDDR